MKRVGRLALALILALGVGGGAFILTLSPSWADETSGKDALLLANEDAASQADETPAADEDEDSATTGEWQAPKSTNSEGNDGDDAATPAATPDGTDPTNPTAATPAATPEGTDPTNPTDELVDVTTPLDADETQPTKEDEPTQEGEWAADVAAPTNAKADVAAPTNTTAHTAELSPFEGEPAPAEEGSAVDISVLDAALADTSAIVRGNYGQKSWDILLAAIAHAQSVRSNPQATQAEVDAAVSALATAKVGLVLDGSSSGFVPGASGLPLTGDTALPFAACAGFFAFLGTAVLLLRRKNSSSSS